MCDSFQPWEQCEWDKVGQGCSGERGKDQHGSVVGKRESFQNRDDRDHCSEQDLTPCYLEKKNIFSRADGWDNPGQQGLGRFFMQKELLPTPILTAAQGEGAKEHLPACRGAGLPEAKQFPAQNKTPGTASTGMWLSLLPIPLCNSPRLRMDTGHRAGSAPGPAGPTPSGHHQSQAIPAALKLIITLGRTTSGWFTPKAFSM